MVQMHIEYEGQLRCRAVHGPSEAQLSTDAPLDNHGRGESFSPTDLVATALGTCMLTLVGIRAEEGGWDIAGARAQVTKSMVQGPKRRIGMLEVQLSFPRDPGPEARAALEEAALTCPVHGSLHPDIELPIRFAWGQG